MVAASISAETVIGVLVVLQLIGLSIAAYFVMKKK
jgi:hypothetical protein